MTSGCMPPPDNSSIDDVALADFQAACRATALRAGSFEFELKQDPTTHAPVLIVETSEVEPQTVYQTLYELADRYELAVAIVPASAVSRSSFTAYPAP